MTEAKPASPVERRQITVLFYDLVGSTKLSNACDPEDFRDAIQRFHEIVTRAVQPYQAFVGAHVGDGGIVYFGYPVAREDAAECAVLAAMALAQAVTSLTLPDGRTAQARTGIATGTGVVGRIEDGDTGNSAVGAVTSLAARLQGQCRPGQTVISDTTRKLVGQLFDLEDLGHLEAKGIDGGAQAFRVKRRSALDRFEALHDGSASMIGRRAERDQLETHWQNATGSSAANGNSNFVVITAEAGVGKSRFVMEFSREKGREGANRMTLFCAPHSQSSALRPFVTYLRRRAAQAQQAALVQDAVLNGKAAPGETPEAVTLEGLRQVLVKDTLERDFTLLARLLDLNPPPIDDLKGLTPPQILDATIDALLGQIERWSRESPVIFVFEDLHWADPTSLVLIERMLSGRSIGRTLAIITARPEHDGQSIGLERASQVPLKPFSAEDTNDLVNRILGGTASTKMIAAIRDRAGGVPLFIEELTRAVLDNAAYVQGEGARVFELSEDFILPETLQDSLLARLDSLGPVKRVAQIAAVIGRLFPVSLLAELMGDAGIDAVAGCNKLEAAGMVVAMGEAGEDSPSRYVFRHVLIQEFAYSTLVKRDRRMLNGNLLDALEAAEDQMIGGDPADPERRAHYAEEAGRPDRAVHYWHLAGLQALAQSTMPEAEARLRSGLALIPEVGDKRERARLELELQLALGRVLLARYGHASAEIGETFQRARNLADHVGDRRQVLAALHGLQAHDLQHSRMVSARNRSAEMLSLAEADGDDVWAVIGYRSRGISSFPLGEYRQSADDLGNGLKLLDKVDLQAVRGIVVDDIQAAMQIYRSWSLIFLGEKEEGGRISREALVRAKDMGQPYTLAFANIGRLYTKLLADDLDKIDECFETTFALCDEYDIWYFMATARIFQGWYQTMIGDDRAAETVAEGMTDYRKTGSILYQPTYMHWQALAHLQAGELDQSREINDWTIETSETYEMHHQMGEYFGLRAVLLDQSGDAAGALQAMTKANEINEAQGAVHCAGLNDRLWLKHGLRDMAGELQE